jgi:hypothetical protein
MAAVSERWGCERARRKNSGPSTRKASRRGGIRIVIASIVLFLEWDNLPSLCILASVCLYRLLITDEMTAKARGRPPGTDAPMTSAGTGCWLRGCVCATAAARPGYADEGEVPGDFLAYKVETVTGRSVAPTNA